MSRHKEYVEQVEFLTEYPEAIERHWARALGIFGAVTPDGSGHGNNCPWDESKTIGCLTVIRGIKDRGAWTEKLTKEIKKDKRIPTSVFEIRLEHLPIFLEWRERIDKELGVA